MDKANKLELYLKDIAESLTDIGITLNDMLRVYPPLKGIEDALRDIHFDMQGGRRPSSPAPKMTAETIARAEALLDGATKMSAFVEEDDDFLDDEQKMADFRRHSKKEFLESYSYLSEKEYDVTKAKVELLEIARLNREVNHERA